MIKQLPSEKIKEYVKSNPKCVLLDVRTEEEYYGPLGHIDGSILIPINELEDRIDELHNNKITNIQ